MAQSSRRNFRSTAAHTAWIEPDTHQSLTFHAVGQQQPFSLVPLNQIIHERYAVYLESGRQAVIDHNCRMRRPRQPFEGDVIALQGSMGFSPVVA